MLLKLLLMQNVMAMARNQPVISSHDIMHLMILSTGCILLTNQHMIVWMCVLGMRQQILLGTSQIILHGLPGIQRVPVTEQVTSDHWYWYAIEQVTSDYCH
jgi:hypothetical protein